MTTSIETMDKNFTEITGFSVFEKGFSIDELVTAGIVTWIYQRCFGMKKYISSIVYLPMQY